MHSVLSLASGAYQTSLVSYFTHRDLFPALAKVWDPPFNFPYLHVYVLQTMKILLVHVLYIFVLFLSI